MNKYERQLYQAKLMDGKTKGKTRVFMLWGTLHEFMAEVHKAKEEEGYVNMDAFVATWDRVFPQDIAEKSSHESPITGFHSTLQHQREVMLLGLEGMEPFVGEGNNMHKPPNTTTH